jgi:hypothetical protein
VCTHSAANAWDDWQDERTKKTMKCGSRRVVAAVAAASLAARRFLATRAGTSLYLALISALLVLFLCCDYMGVFLHPFELDYHVHFSHPLEGDVRLWASQRKRGLRPDVAPVNDHDYRLTKSADCDVRGAPAHLVFLIRSSMANFEQRRVVRRTYGSEERRAGGNVSVVRTVFLLGSCEDESCPALQAGVDAEDAEFHDLVQVS